MKIKMLIDRKPKRLGVGVAEILVSYLIVKMSEKNKLVATWKLAPFNVNVFFIFVLFFIV